MTPPLLHTTAGFIRSMQMSKTQLFAFMEGHENDPYVYSKICEAVCHPVGISYEHRIAREVPPGAGGKNALLVFFRYLRRRKLLVNDFKGKRTALVFFLDKDIDDVLRTRVRSTHVVYTQYYDVENHLFAAADLAEAAAAAASYDRAVIQRAIGNHAQWRARVAATWKDWVKLCIFARRRRIPGEYNYGVTSRINTPLNGPTDPGALALRMAQLQAATGMPHDKFRRAFGRVSRFVDNLFRQGRHGTVFKGKWYATLLSEEIRVAAGGRPYNDHNLANRLLAGIVVSVPFDDPWSEYFKRAVGDVVRLL